jgi:hypothetical protein
MSVNCTGEIVPLFNRIYRPYATGDPAVLLGSDLGVRYYIFPNGTQGLFVSLFRGEDTACRIIGDQLQTWTRWEVR